MANTVFAVTDEDVELFCECGGSGCLQLLQIPAPVFDEVRSDNGLFIAQPGHEQLGQERVTVSAQRYVVVRSRRGTRRGTLSAASAGGNVQAPSPGGHRRTDRVRPVGLKHATRLGRV